MRGNGMNNALAWRLSNLIGVGISLVILLAGSLSFAEGGDDVVRASAHRALRVPLFLGGGLMAIGGAIWLLAKLLNRTSRHRL
jgi:hypothetical protein